MSRADLIEQRIQSHGPRWCRAAVWSASVAAAFSLAVAALLAAGYARGRDNDPLQNPRLEALKARLRAAPDDAALKARIRSMDLELRRASLRDVEFQSRGAYLLLGGAAVFLIAVRYAALFGKTVPRPQGQAQLAEEQAKAVRLGRWSVATVGLGLAAAAGAVVFGPTWSAPSAMRARGENWPRFRGPDGTGVFTGANVPTDWDGATGRNIRWKTPIALPGENSPILWAGRVFVSGGSAARREVYCFDADTGRQVWQRAVRNVPGSPSEPFRAFEATGYAAPTLATDGRRVYAVFANGDVAAFRLSGEPVWARNLGKPDNAYNHASSPVTWNNRLIIQLDQGNKAEAGLSAIMALDGETGMVVWETQRPVPSSWSTPIVIKVGSEEQIVTCGNPWVIGYAPATGDELWRVQCLKGEVAPSPTFAGGLVYVCNEKAALAAIRPDGLGDVTTTHVTFKVSGEEEDLPNICSPLSDGQVLFLVRGVTVTCRDAKTGQVLWEHEFEDPFSASPSLVGDRVYALDDKGVMQMFKAARTFAVLGSADLGEECTASPAFADGRIYIRGKKHLFCVGKNDGAK